MILERLIDQLRMVPFRETVQLFTGEIVNKGTCEMFILTNDCDGSEFDKVKNKDIRYKKKQCILIWKRFVEIQEIENYYWNDIVSADQCKIGEKTEILRGNVTNREGTKILIRKNTKNQKLVDTLGDNIVKYVSG